MNNDWIIATTKGLQSFETLLECREKNLFRNRKVPRPQLPFDNVLKPAILRQERKRDRFEDDIMKTILEKEEDPELEEKPL